MMSKCSHPFMFSGVVRSICLCTGLPAMLHESFAFIAASPYPDAHLNTSGSLYSIDKLCTFDLLAAVRSRHRLVCASHGRIRSRGQRMSSQQTQRDRVRVPKPGAQASPRVLLLLVASKGMSSRQVPGRHQPAERSEVRRSTRRGREASAARKTVPWTHTGVPM